MIDIKHDALFLARHMLDTSEGSVKRIDSEHQKAIACAERLVTALGTKEEFYNLLTEKAANLLGVQWEPLLSAMNECCKHFDNLAMRSRGSRLRDTLPGSLQFLRKRGRGNRIMTRDQAVRWCMERGYGFVELDRGEIVYIENGTIRRCRIDNT